MEELKSKTKVAPVKQVISKAYAEFLSKTEPPAGKLQTKFTENYIKWEVLERIGNYVFLQGESVSGGRKIFDQQLVSRDKDNMEFCKSPMNWASMTDRDRKPGDPLPDQFVKEKTYANFLLNIKNNENAILKRAQVAEENRIASALREKHCRIIADARAQLSHLVQELHEMTDKSENLQGIFSNKRGKEILQQIAYINMFLITSKVL